MSFVDVTLTPLRQPGISVTNTHYVSGHYVPAGGDVNFNYTQQEMSLFSTYVPAGLTVPLLTSRSLVIGPSAVLQPLMFEEEGSITGGMEGGGSQRLPQNVPGISWIHSAPLNSTATGNVIHEWGHAVDNQFMYKYGGNSFQLTQNNAAIIAAWARAQTLFAGGGPSNFYAWTNILEFWAELFRFHWLGSHGANVAITPWLDGSGSGFGHTNLTPDQMFRGILSGPSAEPGPDDSTATGMHTLIAGLTAPYPAVPIPQ